MIDTPTPQIEIDKHTLHDTNTRTLYIASCTGCGWEGGWAPIQSDAQDQGNKHLMRGCRKVQR